MHVYKQQQLICIRCAGSLTGRERGVSFRRGMTPFVTAKQTEATTWAHKREAMGRWWQADHHLQRGMGVYHETTRVCSYVLSRPGSVRSVDRSRGFRVKGVRLRQDRARRRRGRRAGIPVEGVVDESGLRHTLAAVPESASLQRNAL